jgi:hypothetical protein
MGAHQDEPNTPEPGTDSKVHDWFGQSVQADADLADALTEGLGPDDAEEVFDEVARGGDVQDARHGDHIDPDQGTSAYRAGDD